LAVKTFGMSERRACELLGVWRSSCRYERKPDRNEKLREQLVALAHERPRFGYQIIGILKRHEAGQKVSDLAGEHGISEATIYNQE
jgi:hypothetical protein